MKSPYVPSKSLCENMSEGANYCFHGLGSQLHMPNSRFFFSFSVIINAMSYSANQIEYADSKKLVFIPQSNIICSLKTNCTIP